MPTGDPICGTCGMYLSMHTHVCYVPKTEWFNKSIDIQRTDLLEKIDSLERHITWMQTVSTEQVETIRELRRTIQHLENQIKGI